MATGDSLQSHRDSTAPDTLRNRVKDPNVLISFVRGREKALRHMCSHSPAHADTEQRTYSQELRIVLGIHRTDFCKRCGVDAVIRRRADDDALATGHTHAEHR